LVRANGFFYSLFGYTAEGAGQEGFLGLRAHTHLADHKALRRSIKKGIYTHGEEFEMEFRGMHRDGTVRWFLARCRYWKDSHEITGVLLDITDRKEKEEEVRKEQIEKTRAVFRKEYYRDPLTGLYNRKGVMEAFASLISVNTESHHGFIMIDLDNFKAHNDYGGHTFGDQVLEGVAFDLMQVFGEEAIVGRLGGDEFVVIMKDISGKEEVERKAVQVNRRLGRVLDNGRPLSLSQGISLYPENGTSFSDLYKRGDVALYEAKRRGKNQFVFYEPSLDQRGFGDPSARELAEALVDQAMITGDIRDTQFHELISLNVFQSLMEAAPGGIAIYEKIGDRFVTRYINDGLLHIFRITRETYNLFYREDALKVVSRESLTGLEEAIQQAAIHPEKEPVDFVYRLSSHVASQPIWLHGRGKYIPYGEGRGFFLVMSNDITRYKEKEALLVGNQQCYRWALEKSGLRLWDYDLTTGIFVNAEGIQYRGAEGLVEAKVVHPDSARDLVQLFEEMHHGKVTGETMIRGRIATQEYEWLKLSYRLVYGEEGQPLRALGITEKAPVAMGTKRRFLREEWIRKYWKRREWPMFQVNLSTNLVEKIHCPKGRLCQQEVPGTYEELLSLLVAMIVGDQKAASFEKHHNRGTLVKAFSIGQESLEKTIHMKDESGKLRWTTITQRLLIHPDTGDLYCYTYIKDDESRMKREMALMEPMDLDPVTGLYMEAFLRNRVDSPEMTGEWNVQSLLIVDMLSYWSQKRQLGQQEMDKALAVWGEDIRLILPSHILCSIKERGEFLFFLSQEAGEEQEEVTKAFFDQIHQLFQKTDPKGIFIFAGGAAHREDGESYTDLYRKAYSARNVAAREDNWGYANYQLLPLLDNGLEAEGTEGFRYYDPAGERGSREIQPEEEETLVGDFLYCTSCFLENEDIEKAILLVFQRLAKHYYAERVFFVEVAENPYRAISNYGWSHGESGLSRDFHLEDETVTHPIFENALLRKEAIVIPDVEKVFPVDSIVYRDLKKRGIQSMMAVPCHIDRKFVGFLGVVNALSYEKDFRLLANVGYIIGAEISRSRMVQREDHCERYDELTGFFNRKAYLEIVDQLNPDVLSSLGVVTVDLNGEVDLNTPQGVRQWNDLVGEVGEKLKELIYDGVGFRVTDREFVILYMDLESDSFVSIGRRIQTELRAAFPGSTSSGYCWSSEDIDVDRLLIHSAELKRADHLKYRENTLQQVGKHHDETLRKLLTDIKTGQYMIFFQPIMEATTEEMRSAEALLRGVDAQGNLILPRKFVPNYEALGLIRYLDMFVLEETCKTMSQWREEKLPMVPVSVNLSRETILVPDILPKMIEISNRYRIPRKMIQIEVTERVGDIEESTIARVANAIKESGFSLAIDDFGSEYSNLSVVSRLELDALKIDRGLIAQMEGNQGAEIVVRTILSLCEEMGLVSVAEGVETLHQKEMLVSLGCDYFQGFLFSKALPVKEFTYRYLEPKRKEEENDIEQ
jgi:diguanylate cyclase (GGDEF)-like protein/PAS domain S-box-containing protein